MIKFLKYTCLALLTVVANSCSGFLDKMPESSIPEGESIQTVEEAYQAEIGIYSALKTASLYSGYLALAPDIQADLFYAVDGYTNAYGDIYKWQIKSTNSEPESVYSTLYAVIGRANLLLDKLPALEAEFTTSADIESLKISRGVAHFARALAYSELIKTFCEDYEPETSDTELGVSLITSYLNPEKDRTRSSLQKSYELVIADLEAAAVCFKDRDGAANATEFSNDTVNALLARVYLYMHKWKKAADCATDVIESGNYALVNVTDQTLSANYNDYKAMWRYDSGNEIIWKVAFTSTDYGGSLSTMFHHYNTDYTNFYPDYIPADWVVDLYDSADLRADAFFTYQTTGYDHGLQAYIFLKNWTNPSLDENAGQTMFRNMPKVFRLSEQYLIRAEAYYNMGEDQLASADITSLRKARYSSYGSYSGSKDALFKVIKEERVKELIAEGFRLNDLKRWGEGFKRTPQSNTVSGTTANAKKVAAGDALFVWPIPQHEIDAVPNIQPNRSNNY